MNRDVIEPNTRVLVIDDNRSIHDDFRKILSSQEDAGALAEATLRLFGPESASAARPIFYIESAYQGEDGLGLVAAAVAAGTPYAVAFVDIRMPPGWDGVETVSRLWEVQPDLQVVICTAYSDYSSRQLFDRLGLSDRLLILKKPFDNIEVQQLAIALSEKWRVTQQARMKMDELGRQVEARTAEAATRLHALQQSIAQREQIEASLRASEEKFAKAFATNPAVVSITRWDDGTYLEVNPAFVRATGFEAHEVVGRSPLQLGLFARPEDFGRLRQQLVEQGEVKEFEVQFRWRDGSARDCVVAAAVMEVQQVRCVLAIVRDVTEERRMEEELIEARRIEAMGQLAGGIAHDYNNVLTATLVQLGLLGANPEMPAAVRLALQDLEKMANRSASLTRQLLAFSRQQVLQFRTVDLNELVRHLAKPTQRHLLPNVTLHIETASSPLTIEADPAMIEQVVTNLCVNAAEAMQPSGGVVTVTTARVKVEAGSTSQHRDAITGDYACLTVRDTGRGMDRATLHRIWEPFFTTKDVSEGAGLGLPTVHGIVKQHHGWVDAESVPERGSQFEVFLPLAQKPVHPVPPPSAPKAVQPGGTILLVEDEEMVRTLVTRALERSGYTVLPAADGPQALEVWDASSSSIDLLFTDMVMPNGLSGLELAQKLRQDRPDLPVIITSGYSVDLKRLGVPTDAGFAFVEKPYQFDVLRSLVASRIAAAG